MSDLDAASRTVLGAVTRIEDAPAFIDEPHALHALDEGEAEHRSVLLVSLAFRAALARDILARRGKHLHDLGL